jgi:uncharacterized protein YbjT (DUF2867 family)
MQEQSADTVITTS